MFSYKINVIKTGYWSQNPSLYKLDKGKFVFINLWHSGEAGSLSIHCIVLHDMTLHQI